MPQIKTTNYDIGLNIVLFLQRYNRRNNVKFRITSSALNRLDKFITILAKIIFLNSCLITLNGNKSTVTYWTNSYVTELVLRGYEINIERFKQDYDQITNPINDLGKSSIETYSRYDSRTYEYSHDFQDPLDKILNEIINLYGEGNITKSEQSLSVTIISIIFCVLDICISPDKMEIGKEYIIDTDILSKVADLEDIIKIDNVLGGNDILKFDVPEFEDITNTTFEEIEISDLTKDNIEEVIKNSNKHKIRYKGYPFGLDDLVIDL
jgi:hypothetical protein